MRKKLFFAVALMFSVIQVYSQLVEPVKTNEKYGFTFKNLYFEVDTNIGARITSWKIDGNEILYLTSNNMSGSTFWPSPQSVWVWEPAPALDKDPYTAEIKDNKLICKGKNDSIQVNSAATFLSFYKIFSADEADTSVTIEYIMKNNKSTAQTWAPWEVTRVPNNGLTFFGKGEGSVTGTMAAAAKELNSCIWYNQNVYSSGSKFLSDGKGWLAHVTPSKQIFIKVFPDITKTKAAPGEAEVEIYTDHGKYTELENQGAYASIAGKDSVSWKVKWYLRNLPGDITVEAGNQKLLDFVQKVTNLDIPTGIKSERFNAIARVFPNPASNYIKVSSSKNSSCNIEISDLSGRNIIKQQINTAANQIDISSLKNGIYLYEINFQNGEQSKGNFIKK